MGDEQPIYLDQDDDLDRVTERLASTSMQRVMMIVPQQTEMRSNVFWRLLHSRVRNMGKDVTVISADRQIRAVAKVVGFRVADSLASSPPGKTRPSRFVRSASEIRQARQSRSQDFRSEQSFRPDESERRSGEIRDNRGAEVGNRPSAELATAQEPASQHTWSEAESNAWQAEDTIGGQGMDDDYDRPFEYRIGTPQAVPLPPQPQRNSSDVSYQDPFSPDYIFPIDDEYDLPFEYKIEAPPPTPLQPQPQHNSGDEPDQDPYSPNYELSREIVESWRRGLAPQSTSTDISGSTTTDAPSSSLVSQSALQEHQQVNTPSSSATSTNISEQTISTGSQGSTAIKLFYCYAREDKALLAELEKHLGNLRRQGKITAWLDRDISAGKDWKKEIDINLNTADIILLLVSPDFIDSDFCYGVEMIRALERHQNNEARVIPVILRPVDWEDAPFSELQVLPADGKPVYSALWHNRDEAFWDIAKGIRKVVKEILDSRR